MAALPLSPRASATLETVNGSIMAAITSLGGSIWVHQLEQPGQQQQPLSRLVSNVGNDAHLGDDVPLGPRFTVIVSESLPASSFGHRNDDQDGIQLIAAASKVLIAWPRASLASFGPVVGRHQCVTGFCVATVAMQTGKPRGRST